MISCVYIYICVIVIICIDVIPDEIADLNKKRKMMRWDAKKRKFVKVRNKYIVNMLIEFCMNII